MPIVTTRDQRNYKTSGGFSSRSALCGPLWHTEMFMTLSEVLLFSPPPSPQSVCEEVDAGTPGPEDSH